MADAGASGATGTGVGSRKAEAVATMLAACIITALQDSTIKWMSGSYPFHEMQTIRCGVALLCVFGFVVWQGGLTALKAPRMPLVIFRGLLLGIASVLFYLCAAAMPYPEAVALYFTMPLLVAGLASPLMGERVPLYRWIAVGIGFCGVLVILRPGSALFEPAAFFALAAAAFYAVGNLLTRPLSGRVGLGALAFWQNFMYVAVAVVLSLAFGDGTHRMTGHVSLDYLTRGWIMPTLPDLALIVVLGISTGSLMVLYTLAYRLAESSFVAPFEYSAMLWAVLVSFLIWHQWPEPWALLGIALISAGGLFLFATDGRGRR